MSHTPGPWEVYVGEKRTEILCNAGVPVAHVYVNGRANGANYHLRVRGNSALIAAAPDLLEACKLIKSVTQQTENVPSNQLDRIFDIATAAIAKAEPTEE